MRIPNDPIELSRFLRFIVDTCMQSQKERNSLYQKRRRYFMYGQNKEEKVKFNRLKSHIELVTSFLYSAEGLVYNISAPQNAEEVMIQQMKAIEDRWNETVRDSGLADAADQAIMWGVVLDSMFMKIGWNDISQMPFATLINPGNFGVFREDLDELDAQPAMVHSFIIDYDDAIARLRRGGLASRIPDLVTSAGGEEDMGLPSAVQQLIIASTSGTNLAGNVSGAVNPNYEASPMFAPRLDQPMCHFYEPWVWDDETGDWRIFHFLDPDIVLADSRKTIEALERAQKADKKPAPYDSKSNFFLKHETPFVHYRPYDLYDYFYGDCHLEDLIGLQNWQTERLEQINEILEQQSDPAKVFSGFVGLDDEKAEALGGPGTWVADGLPSAKVDRLAPQMPEDLFAEFNQIASLFMEQSGLTETIAGKGSQGVRSKSHAQQLNITGGGRIRRVAVGLEQPLVQMGNLGIKLMMRNDPQLLKTDEAMEFVAGQADPTFTMRIAGHSHSPLFTTETRELATILLKSRAIDRARFVRMLNPTAQDAILHELKRIEASEAQAMQAKAAAPTARRRA